MSITVMPNRGILFNDGMDELRSAAIVACHALRGGGVHLPPALAEYMHALERNYLHRLHQDHLKSLDDVGWEQFVGEPTP